MGLNFIELFKKLGLTDTETKIYFANLQLGPSTVQEIAKRAKFSRTAAYDAIDSLRKKGLLSTHEKGLKKFFVAEEPERVIGYFRTRVKEMEENVDVLDRARTELSLLGGGEKPTVRFYEGDAAIRVLFEDVVKSGANVLREVSDVEMIAKNLNMDKVRQAQKLLDGKNIKLKILHKGSSRKGRPDTEWLKIPDNFPHFAGDIWIYGDHVSFVSLEGKMSCVLIENKAFAETARVLFDLAALSAENTAN